MILDILGLGRGRARASGCILVINANSCSEVERNACAAPVQGKRGPGLGGFVGCRCGLDWSRLVDNGVVREHVMPGLRVVQAYHLVWMRAVRL
jgi:hypothetical protein